MPVAVDVGPEAETVEIFDVVVAEEMEVEAEESLPTLNAVEVNAPENSSSDADQVAYQNQTGQPYYEDQPSPELFGLRFANFGKSIVE